MPQLKALTAPAEDASSKPSTHMAAHSSSGIQCFPGVSGMYMVHRHPQTKHSYFFKGGEMLHNLLTMEIKSLREL